MAAGSNIFMKGIVPDYLKALLHQVDQADFEITAGVKAVQVTRVNLLSTKLRIALQINFPFTLVDN